MNKRLALAAAMLAARAAMAIPYADTADTPAASPGELQWRRAADGSPYLTVSSFGGGREVVRDPDALRRVPVTRLAATDLLAELGEGVGAEGGWIVLADNVQPGSAAITREAWITAPAGLAIRSLAATNAGDAAISIEYAAGRARVFTSIAPPPPGATPPPVNGRFALLYADALPEDAPAPADTRDGDFLFTDAIGDCSLGTLREWALGQHNGHMAEDWSRYPADPSRPVRLDGAPLVMDPFHRFRAEVRDGTNDLDTLAIYAAGRPALEIVSEVSQTNSAFRILSFSLDGATARMAVTAIGTNVAVLASAGPLSPSMEWAEVEGAAVDYAPDTEGGAPCWRVAFPAAAGRFFRARTTIGAESRTAVRVRAPLVLESPDGGLWRLRVGNDGTLSTEAWQ